MRKGAASIVTFRKPPQNFCFISITLSPKNTVVLPCQRTVHGRREEFHHEGTKDTKEEYSRKAVKDRGSLLDFAHALYHSAIRRINPHA